jgi:hypothetical protein
VYWRVATEEEVVVKRISRGGQVDALKKLINPRYGDSVRAWTEGTCELPDDWEEQLSWEEAWMNAVMSRGALEIPRLTAGASVDGAPTQPVDETRRLPDGVPMSQQPPSQAVVAITPSGANREYVIPVPVVNSGARLRERFRFADNAKQHTSASSSSRPASPTVAPCGIADETIHPDSDDDMLAPFVSPPSKEFQGGCAGGAPTTGSGSVVEPSFPGPAHSVAGTPCTKRVKVEPQSQSCSNRGIKEARVAALKKQLYDAQEALDTPTPATPIKSEALPQPFGSPYRQIVRALAQETSANPMEIDDSP